jgi:hypothetical protein
LSSIHFDFPQLGQLREIEMILVPAQEAMMISEHFEDRRQSASAMNANSECLI